MDHRILCLEEEDGRVLAAGTGGEDGVATRRWTAAEVVRAIRGGERFYVVSPNTGWDAQVELDDGEIASALDEAGEDCLRALRSCRWR